MVCGCVTGQTCDRCRTAKAAQAEKWRDEGAYDAAIAVEHAVAAHHPRCLTNDGRACSCKAERGADARERRDRAFEQSTPGESAADRCRNKPDCEYPWCGCHPPEHFLPVLQSMRDGYMGDGMYCEAAALDVAMDAIESKRKK